VRSRAQRASFAPNLDIAGACPRLPERIPPKSNAFPPPDALHANLDSRKMDIGPALLTISTLTPNEPSFRTVRGDLDDLGVHPLLGGLV
jgi:hypothetical protein